MTRLLIFMALTILVGALFPGLRRFARRAVGLDARPLGLDQRPFGYGVEAAREALAALGAEGRARHLKRVLPYDRVFAVAYGLAGAAAGIALARYLGQQGYASLSLLAAASGLIWAAGMAATIAEGLLLARLIRAYPALEAGAIRATSAVTRLKFTLLALGGAGLVALAGIAAVAWMKS